MLPAYRPLIPSTIMRARRQVQRVRDEKPPSVHSSQFSPDAPTNVSAPERHHPDWSPVFMNPVYRSPPHKIARTMTGPAAYAPVLVQRALALGACSPEAEARAGKASSSNSSSIKGVDVVQAPPAVADPAPSVWKPVSPTSSAAQASAIRAEVTSRKRDQKDISSSDAIKEASARGEATTGDAIAGEKRRDALEELLQERSLPMPSWLSSVVSRKRMVLSNPLLLTRSKRCTLAACSTNLNA